MFLNAAGDTSTWARTIGRRVSGSANYVGLVNNVVKLMKLDENQVKESLVPDRGERGKGLLSRVVTVPALVTTFPHGHRNLLCSSAAKRNEWGIHSIGYRYIRIQRRQAGRVGR